MKLANIESPAITEQHGQLRIQWSPSSPFINIYGPCGQFVTLTGEQILEVLPRIRSIARVVPKNKSEKADEPVQQGS